MLYIDLKKAMRKIKSLKRKFREKRDQLGMLALMKENRSNPAIAKKLGLQLLSEEEHSKVAQDSREFLESMHQYKIEIKLLEKQLRLLGTLEKRKITIMSATKNLPLPLSSIIYDYDISSAYTDEKIKKSLRIDPCKAFSAVLAKSSPTSDPLPASAITHTLSELSERSSPRPVERSFSELSKRGCPVFWSVIKVGGVVAIATLAYQCRDDLPTFPEWN